MRTRAGLAAAALVAALAPSALAAGPVTVAVDRTAVATKLGRSFTIRSEIANRGPVPLAGLVAHLNVLSLRGDVYVDPEDWSSHRTRYLPRLPAHGATAITWKLGAVNAGRIGVYVTVVPRARSGPAPATSPVVRVGIADRRTLDAGGILPLALGLPALLGLALLAARLGGARRARRR